MLDQYPFFPIATVDVGPPEAVRTVGRDWGLPPRSLKQGKDSMQANRMYCLIATIVLGALIFGPATTHAQTTTTDTRIGELKYEGGFPTKETVEKLYDEIDFQRASQAYMWSFPP
jgi:hypothetical protein